MRALSEQDTRVVINYRASKTSAGALAAGVGADRAVALRADVTDRAALDPLLADAATHFCTKVTAVVGDALPDFSATGDSRPKAADIGRTTSRHSSRARSAAR